jgi:hypothetical protein
MGNEPIKVTEPDKLSTQARLHYDIRDFCQQIAGEFENKAEAVASQLTDKQTVQYRQWWAALKAHLLKMAQQHDQFGQHLDAARTEYEKLEPHVARSFTTGHTT